MLKTLGAFSLQKEKKVKALGTGRGAKWEKLGD